MLLGWQNWDKLCTYEGLAAKRICYQYSVQLSVNKRLHLQCFQLWIFNIQVGSTVLSHSVQSTQDHVSSSSDELEKSHHINAIIHIQT